MKIEVRTDKGNVFDIEDSILLTALGESDICNAALSFYNEELQYGISYFPDRNMFVFQTDNYDIEYWNDDKYNEMINELSKHINLKELDDTGLPFEFDFIVNYFLNEMDKYYDWETERNNEFCEALNKILEEV